MSPFKISLFSRIGSSVLSAIGAIGGAVSAIIGEYFYDFTEQDTDGFVGATEEYLTADGSQLNYFRSPAVSPSGESNIKSFYFEFYIASTITENDTGDEASLFTEVVGDSNQRILIGYLTSGYSGLNLRTDNSNWTAVIGDITAGNHTLLITYDTVYKFSLDDGALTSMTLKTGDGTIGTINNKVISIMQRPSSSSFRDFQEDGYISKFQITNDSDEIILDFRNKYGANGTTYDWNGYTFTRYVGDATKKAIITYRLEDTGTEDADYHLSPYTGIVGKFDGTSVISLPSDLSSDISSATGFIHMGLYLDSSIANASKIINLAQSSVDFLRLIYRNDDTIDIHVRDSSTEKWIIELSDILYDEIFQLTIVQDGVEPIVYLNGSEANFAFTISTDKTVWFDSLDISGERFIGGESTSSDLITGLVSNFIIGSDVPNATQVEQMAARPELTKDYLVNTVGITWSNVVAFYPLTENGGNTAYDYSDNGNHGTWTNPDWETGLSTARQLGLQNVSRYVDTTSLDSHYSFDEITLGDNFTISMNVLSTDETKSQALLSRTTSNLPFLSLITATVRRLAFRANNTTTILFSIHTSMVKNEMLNITMICENNEIIVYVKDVSNTEGYIGKTADLTLSKIGNNYNNTGSFDGLISDVVIANDYVLDTGVIDNLNTPNILRGLTTPDVDFNYNTLNNFTPGGVIETITLPEKETIAGIPYDVFGFECNSQNIVGEEETLALRGLGYVDYDGHAGPYTDVKQIQFIIKPTSNNHAYILTDEANNRVAYINGNQVVSDFGTSSIYINDVETDIVLTDTWQQVTIEFTTPVDIEKLYIGSSAVPDAFEEFGIDKLNIVKE